MLKLDRAFITKRDRLALQLLKANPLQGVRSKLLVQLILLYCPVDFQPQP